MELLATLAFAHHKRLNTPTGEKALSNHNVGLFYKKSRGWRAE